MIENPNKDVKPIKNSKPTKDELEGMYAGIDEAIKYLDNYFSHEDGSEDTLAFIHYKLLRHASKSFVDVCKAML